MTGRRGKAIVAEHTDALPHHLVRPNEERKALNFTAPAGINNQNFLMRDEETGSWWQQVTGEAIQGPLKGRKLAPVSCDEVSFAIWRTEQPRSRFLSPDPRLEKHYVTADWESNIGTSARRDAQDRPRRVRIAYIDYRPGHQWEGQSIFDG